MSGGGRAGIRKCQAEGAQAYENVKRRARRHTKMSGGGRAGIRKCQAEGAQAYENVRRRARRHTKMSGGGRAGIRKCQAEGEHYTKHKGLKEVIAQVCFFVCVPSYFR